MSMIGWVQALSPTQIDTLRAKPSLASTLAMAATVEQMDADLAETLSRLPPQRKEAAEARRRAFEQSPAGQKLKEQQARARAAIDSLGPLAPALSLEKSWHVLHYLFTGHADASDAPGDTLLTGEEIGDDIGYGPCRLHDVAETAAFARFLETQDLARLKARVNYREMSQMQIYAVPMGRGSDGEYENELREEVGVYFPRLRDYVAATAKRQNGLLLWAS